MKKINIITMGCSKNIVDSEVLMRQLAGNNFTLSESSDGADVAVINTCGFIEAAKQESIDTILHAVRLKQEGRLKKVVVMGCLSERYADALRKEIPDVDEFIGANKMDEVLRRLGGTEKHELIGERLLTTPRHYAYLKISEGCDRPCSFCAIPLMRGKHVSKPRERLVLEAKRLAALGVRELVIIAQDSTYYGLDLYGRRELAPLLRDLASVEGIGWIRLMYAFPAGFPMDVLPEFKRFDTICNYIDMPVQHVSDPILTSMRRGITSDGLRKLIGSIRDQVPGIALRTTLIVGYPGETDREFGELLRFIEETKFDRLGVFTYSQEEGTSAYPLGDPVPAAVKEERFRQVMELQQQISRTANASFVGKKVKILVDERDGDTVIGRTECDAPEIDASVVVDPGHTLRVGDFSEVTIVDSDEYDLFAVPYEGK
jgi:ribosomal protein S12 methylthiotransferase